MMSVNTIYFCKRFRFVPIVYFTKECSISISCTLVCKSITKRLKCLILVKSESWFRDDFVQFSRVVKIFHFCKTKYLSKPCVVKSKLLKKYLIRIQRSCYVFMFPRNLELGPFWRSKWPKGGPKWGFERGSFLGYWALQTTFAKDSFWYK